MTPPSDAPYPGPLVPSDAVAAIIVTSDRRFLMQQRDPVPHIWYPGAWALFGGAIDPGETELEALRRELKEEIDYDFRTATLFTRFRFDYDFADAGSCLRSIYEIEIDPAEVATMRLGEGHAMALIDADTVIGLPNITGYDQFALYLYINRARIRPARKV